MNTNICFIGAGNMARSLIGGLLDDGTPATCIVATDPLPEAGELLQQRWPGIGFSNDNLAAASDADVVVLAVKPQALRPVCEQLSPLSGQMLFVSIAAGVRADDINRWLGGSRAIVRCMPNTPALVRSGASGLFANDAATEEQRNLAERLLRSVGVTRWVHDESLIDAVTALSGSGPAYFFYLIEAMQEAAEALGLAADDARILALETAFGAAKLALESEDSAAELRAKVTSKGGTTAAAIATFDTHQFKHVVHQAMSAAAQRAEQLADELGQDST